MRGMVTLKRRWSALVGAFLAFFATAAATLREALPGAAHVEEAMEPIQPPHVADIADPEVAAAVREKQGTQITPPPVSEPLTMRWVSARPPQEDEVWHPNWAGNGTGLMPMFTRHYAAASTPVG